MENCIVVADDDPIITSLVSLRLQKAQFKVVTTSDAVAALALTRANAPAAVILDINMPGGGGMAALAKIRADPDLKHLPVMMLTGERTTEMVMQAMTGGADDYMVKPFDPDTLLERVTRLVKSGAAQFRRSAPAAVWEL